MPRVSPTEQYRRYKFLRTAWREFDVLYSQLDTSKQSALHKFYQPSHELTEPELTAHIKAMIKTDPSLAQRAGTYVGIFERLFHLASQELGYSQTQADKLIGTVFARSIRQLNSRDHQLLYTPISSTPDSDAKRHGGKDLNVVARALIRPEPDIEAVTQASLEYYYQMKRKESDSNYAADQD